MTQETKQVRDTVLVWNIPNGHHQTFPKVLNLWRAQDYTTSDYKEIQEVGDTILLCHMPINLSNINKLFTTFRSYGEHKRYMTYQLNLSYLTTKCHLSISKGFGATECTKFYHPILQGELTKKLKEWESPLLYVTYQLTCTRYLSKYHIIRYLSYVELLHSSPTIESLFQYGSYSDTQQPINERTGPGVIKLVSCST